MRECHTIPQIWTFTCLNCERTWKDVFEARYATFRGGDVVTWRHAGAACPPPYGDPCCPSCHSLNVRTSPAALVLRRARTTLLFLVVLPAWQEPVGEPVPQRAAE